MTTIDPRHVEILAGAIREAMRKGKHPSVREVTDVPGGTIEIDGEFDLSTFDLERGKPEESVHQVRNPSIEIDRSAQRITSQWLHGIAARDDYRRTSLAPSRRT
jgi:hypothetical protein